MIALSTRCDVIPAPPTGSFITSFPFLYIELFRVFSLTRWYSPFFSPFRIRLSQLFSSFEYSLLETYQVESPAARNINIWWNTSLYTIAVMTRHYPYSCNPPTHYVYFFLFNFGLFIFFWRKVLQVFRSRTEPDESMIYFYWLKDVWLWFFFVFELSSRVNLCYLTSPTDSMWDSYER